MKAVGFGCMNLLTLILFFLGGLTLSAQEIPVPGTQAFTATLDKLIDDALRNNPSLEAANAKIQASAAAVTYQQSPDPPLVGLEFMQSPVRFFPNLFNNQMEVDYSLQQMIPYPGKLSAMADVERKRTEMLQADRETQEQAIVRNVKNLYYELYLLHRKIEINRDSRDLVQGFVDIASRQYELGMGRLEDILRAQTELSSIANEEIVLEQQVKSMEGMLDALSDRPVTAEIGFIPEIQPAMESFDLTMLLGIAEKNRPELRSMLSNVEMQRAERFSAEKEYLPDFMVRGSYKQEMDGRDNWGMMIGMTLPFAPWSKQKYTAEKARTDANIREAQAESENMRNMVFAEVNDAVQKVESSKAQILLSEESAIPQARQTLESATASYQTGKGDFLMLIDVQRMLVMARLNYHMAVMNLLDSRSQLERAVGVSIEEINGK